MRRLPAALIVVVLIAVSPALAQYAAPPEAYSLEELYSLFAKGEVMQIARDGSKAVIELNVPAGVAGPRAIHTRSIYDLTAHTTYTWDPVDAGAPCSRGTFSGDWGDPFAQSAEILADLAKQHTSQAGTATIAGVTTTIVAVAGPGQAAGARAWIDAKYGLLMRLEDQQHAPLIEVRKFAAVKPPASAFALPPSCAALASQPLPPTEADRIAAATGAPAGAYIDAGMPPASSAPCGMTFKVVHAGTLAPITGGFAVGLDLSQNASGGASISVGSDGAVRFSGGAIKDMTPQLKDGTLGIDVLPPHFELDVVFGTAGSASALIYRQCFQPRATLLLVVTNPSKLSDGVFWLWKK